MKRSIVSCLSILVLVLTACTGIAQKENQKIQHAVIQVIDFHSTHRCMTCNAIEKQSKLVLEKYFKSELEKGLITFQTINVDEDENYNLAEEFEASGTALFLNVLRNGISTKINLTDFAFLNATSDDGSFEKGFKNELDKALKML